MASESLFSRLEILDCAKGPVRVVSAPSAGNLRAVQVVLTLLSVTAGSVDAICFLGLGGLFITGNLVILAAHIAAGDEASLAHVLSFPVFIVALAVTRLLVAGLERMHVTSLRPLLLFQFLLLACFLALCVRGGPRLDPNAANATLALGT